MSERTNMADMFGMFMNMQKKMKQVQEDLASKTVKAEAGGGIVKVTANGVQCIMSITIEPHVVDPNDLEMLEDLVVAGVNKALDESRNMARKEMGSIAGAMLLPGMDMSSLGP